MGKNNNKYNHTTETAKDGSSIDVELVRGYMGNDDHYSTRREEGRGVAFSSKESLVDRVNKGK